MPQDAQSCCSTISYGNPKLLPEFNFPMLSNSREDSHSRLAKVTIFLIDVAYASRKKNQFITYLSIVIWLLACGIPRRFRFAWVMPNHRLDLVNLCQYIPKETFSLVKLFCGLLTLFCLFTCVREFGLHAMSAFEYKRIEISTLKERIGFLLFCLVLPN